MSEVYGGYELNKIYNENCLEAMKKLPDKCFELAIVDPPYGIGEAIIERNNSRTKLAKAKCYPSFAGKNKSSPEKEYFDEVMRVSNNQIIWGANHFISKMPYDSSCWIVWDKKNGATCYADCELAWTSFKTAVRKFEFRWSGMLQENMKNKEFRIHPTQKPVALYKWLLTNYAKPGDKILDTHGGSCNSAKACHDLGFDYLIFELDKHYFDKATESVNQHKAQLSFFNLAK